jgi:hypothetical protein
MASPTSSEEMPARGARGVDDDPGILVCYVEREGLACLGGAQRMVVGDGGRAGADPQHGADGGRRRETSTLRLRQELSVGDERRGIRVLEHVGHLRRGEAEVDGDSDGPEACTGEVEFGHLQRVRQHERHVVALRHAETPKEPRGLPDGGIEGAVGDLLLAEDEGHLVAVAPCIGAESLAHRQQRVHPPRRWAVRARAGFVLRRKGFRGRRRGFLPDEGTCMACPMRLPSEGGRDDVLEPRDAGDVDLHHVALP